MNDKTKSLMDYRYTPPGHVSIVIVIVIVLLLHLLLLRGGDGVVE